MTSCILYQNRDSTVTLIDVPGSIEQSLDCLPGQRLVSSTPLQHPYPSVEPKSAKALANLKQVPLQDLIVQKHLQIALDGISAAFKGPWCLPRVTAQKSQLGCLHNRAPGRSQHGPPERKRQRREICREEDEEESPSANTRTQTSAINSVISAIQQENPTADPIFFHNPTSKSTHLPLDSPTPQLAYIPAKCTVLCGDITTSLPLFRSSAPQFNLIILDPPWPNRSARRKQAYEITARTAGDIQGLLSGIPIRQHLREDGLVAVWITNRASFRDLVVGGEGDLERCGDDGDEDGDGDFDERSQAGGLFAEWGVSLVEEWVWVKVTDAGEPVCALDSRWRRPYEVLLVGRKGEGVDRDGKMEGFRRRVVVGVPDLHSRKPNLKVLFEPLMGNRPYEALEIFARNLTSGWWAWGNEILKFQTEQHWVSDPVR